MSSAPNKQCCSDVRYLCPKCQSLFDRMYGRTPQKRSSKMTANSGALVLNSPFTIRLGQSVPLIPPTINFNVDSSLLGEEITLKVSPDMLLPPNTMEVVINARMAELAAAEPRQATHRLLGNPNSGPLIPPKLW